MSDTIDGNASDKAEQWTIKALIYNDKLYDDTAGERFLSEWVSFPATKETIQAALNKIGIYGARDRTYMIDESEFNIESLRDCPCIPKDMIIDEINYLSVILQSMDEYGLEKFKAALHSDDCSDAPGVMYTAANIEAFDLQPAANAKEYGEFLADAILDEIGTIAKEKIADPEACGVLMSRIDGIAKYIDAREYGLQTAKLENGSFTDYGYLTFTDISKELYKGYDDIPTEYRIYDFPVPETKEHSADISAALFPPEIDGEPKPSLIGRLEIAITIAAENNSNAEKPAHDKAKPAHDSNSL